MVQRSASADCLLIAYLLSGLRSCRCDAKDQSIHLFAMPMVRGRLLAALCCYSFASLRCPGSC